MEDRGELDLTLLLDQHQKEVSEYKKKESQWIRDKNQLDGNKQIIEELSAQMVALKKRAVVTADPSNLSGIQCQCHTGYELCQDTFTCVALGPDDKDYKGPEYREAFLLVLNASESSKI